jgi:site-specific recombinase XerD
LEGGKTISEEPPPPVWRAIQHYLNVADLLTAGRCHGLTLDWSQLQFQHVAAVRSRLIEEYAPSTVNKHLSAIRGTLKAAYKLGYIGGEQYRKATDVKAVKDEAEPAGRMLSAQEVGALLRVCTNDPSPAGARDAAMIALWAVAGPRRAEIVNRPEPLRHPDRRCLDPQGEGQQGPDRIHRQRGTPGDGRLAGNPRPDRGPLFVLVHQTGKVRISRMAPQSVYEILQKRAAEAGVTSVSPHDLRRTAISNLIGATDLSTAQKIAGHADPKTTARYDRRGERAKQQAAAKLSLAYRRIR